MIFLLSAPASIPVVWLYDYDDDYQCYSSYSNYQSRWHSCHVRACTIARAIVLLPLPLTLGLPFTQSYENFVIISRCRRRYMRATASTWLSGLSVITISKSCISSFHCRFSRANFRSSCIVRGRNPLHGPRSKCSGGVSFIGAGIPVFGERQSHPSADPLTS